MLGVCNQTCCLANTERLNWRTDSSPNIFMSKQRNNEKTHKGFSLPKAATNTIEDTKTQALRFLDRRCYTEKSNSTIYSVFQLKTALILMNLGKL